MDNNNPAEMSNNDLEKDMQQKNLEQNKPVNEENVNKSTAAEGTLKTPEEDESSKINMSTAYKQDEEQDLDDLVHVRAKESHNGSLPDPEEAKLRGE
ncbi:hypothetical protein [Segetibacter koreensis]|uniref:hypothetical protein n=1 Tax=Segetibacter koreensis TaxID=398037 RepID=UPI00037D624C|nr:hypothetical protein [Segetibacter koreensis]